MDPVTLLIMIVIQVIAYLIMPKPKPPKPAEVQQMDDPTAEPKPIPVVIGQVFIKELMFLYFGNKSIYKYKIKAGGK